ncbi:hypothetical protein PRIPAC_83148 [Pristionchus pacificus]|uniref:Uncharacterized protein n=1 Tax=Pristionchus pacificus TaxID=54126 RepID=A0A454XUV2_PRIPA|nr:hypothetical protein PRIPAC_83148 [Pristionchus pacificus]|eukprot:PDM68677.1 hypothetical protein PRIPAC_46979 [Pristionchus pacificus]
MGNSPATTATATAVPTPVDTALDTLARCLALANNLNSATETTKTAKTETPPSDSTKSATA